MQKEKFILCPVCGNKTRVQIREDTELKNFPLFCPKCHKQTLINAKQLKNRYNNPFIRMPKPFFFFCQVVIHKCVVHFFSCKLKYPFILPCNYNTARYVPKTPRSDE